MESCSQFGKATILDLNTTTLLSSCLRLFLVSVYGHQDMDPCSLVFLYRKFGKESFEHCGRLRRLVAVEKRCQ